MGIIQENRIGTQPEQVVTDYGVTYVKAGEESESGATTEDKPDDEESSEVASPTVDENIDAPKVQVKKRALRGRPKKDV